MSDKIIKILWVWHNGLISSNQGEQLRPNKVYLYRVSTINIKEPQLPSSPGLRSQIYLT